MKNANSKVLEEFFGEFIFLDNGIIRAHKREVYFNVKFDILVVGRDRPACPGANRPSGSHGTQGSFLQSVAITSGRLSVPPDLSNEYTGAGLLLFCRPGDRENRQRDKVFSNFRH